MQHPASSPAERRTCPHCNRPAEPGNKFCATCGTRIPVLFTCRKCGTQFITPITACKLCGGLVVPETGPEPESSPEYPEEEDSGAIEDQAPEQDEEEIPEPDEEEIPEPDTDELPVDHDEEVAAKHETPHRFTREIQEPDTDELLEQYGSEYDEDETLESSHTSKPPSPVKHGAKKPVTVHAPPERESSETVDDVLFLSPEKPKAAAKPRGNAVWIIGICIALVAIVAAVYFIGLPVLTKNEGFSAFVNPPAEEITPLPTPTRIGTITPVAASRGLVPQPTQQPAGQKLYFQVQKNPVTSKISVIYAGSAGEGSLRSADIKVSHPDGSVASGIITPLKGIAEISLDGSKETDRVEIIAQMSDGRTYRVYDQLVPLIG